MFERKKKTAPDSGMENDGIVVIRERDPQTCGGTSTTLDTKAPKEIFSGEMILFDVTSALHVPTEKMHMGSGEKEDIGYISAFAVHAGEGSFLFLETGNGFRKRDRRKQNSALVKGNVFPALCRLVKECRLAERNGYQSHTYGLPENFGGTVNIRYESGERISCSNNQSPVLSHDAGVRIAEYFEKAMKGRRQELPGVDDLLSIRFSEDRTGGGYTKAELTLNPYGTGTNRKESRFDVTVYESTSDMDSRTVAKIKEEIRKSNIFAWEKLPESEHRSGSNEEMVFVFRDGREIRVRKDRVLPDQISRGFFNIQLEMTTKH